MRVDVQISTQTWFHQTPPRPFISSKLCLCWYLQSTVWQAGMIFICYSLLRVISIMKLYCLCYVTINISYWTEKPFILQLNIFYIHILVHFCKMNSFTAGITLTDHLYKLRMIVNNRTEQNIVVPWVLYDPSWN